MPMTLTVHDQLTDGGTSPPLVLEFLTEHITVRELIRSRVYQEVQDYNRRQPEVIHLLVTPSDAERTLNGYRLTKPRFIDWKAQFEKALAAFEHGRFLILVGEHQVESLDEQIVLQPGTAVTFLRLTPLAGG
jgi:hypothetical protein